MPPAETMHRRPFAKASSIGLKSELYGGRAELRADCFNRGADLRVSSRRDYRGVIAEGL
jgi:hypothetical protein